MSTTTPHLSLTKADPSELVNVVTHVNNNSDKIDFETLDHDNRIGALEGLGGISSGWLPWTPVVNYSSTRVVTVTTLKAEYFILNNIVFCSVDFTGLALGAGAPFTNNYFRIKLPYKVDLTLPNISGQLIYVQNTGYVPIRFEDLSIVDENTIVAKFLVWNGAASPPRMVPDTSVSLLTFDPDTTLRGAFSYRTSGVVVP